MLGIFLANFCETFSLFVLYTSYSRHSFFTSLEDTYELFWVSLVSVCYYVLYLPIRNLYYLFFSLSLSVWLLLQILNRCFSLCVLGFVGTKFCTAPSLFMVGVLQTKFCVSLSLSIQCGNKCMTLSLFTVEVLITKFIFLSV